MKTKYFKVFFKAEGQVPLVAMGHTRSLVARALKRMYGNRSIAKIVPTSRDGASGYGFVPSLNAFSSPISGTNPFMKEQRVLDLTEAGYNDPPKTAAEKKKKFPDIQTDVKNKQSRDLQTVGEEMIEVNEDQKRALYEEMKTLLGTSYALSAKTQNYHWNVQGPNFVEYHTFLGGYYDLVSGHIDKIAEQIRTLNFKAPGSLKQFIELSEIEEDATSPNAMQMLANIQKDNEILLACLEEARDAADEAVATGLVNYLEGAIDEFMKQNWFLKSIQGTSLQEQRKLLEAVQLPVKNVKITPSSPDANKDGTVDDEDDLNGDGQVDQQDSKVAIDVKKVKITSTAGDFNGDGKIDGADDINGDGQVDAADKIEIPVSDVKITSTSTDVNGDGAINAKDDLNGDGVVDDKDIRIAELEKDLRIRQLQKEIENLDDPVPEEQAANHPMRLRIKDRGTHFECIDEGGNTIQKFPYDNQTVMARDARYEAQRFCEKHLHGAMQARKTAPQEMKFKSVAESLLGIKKHIRENEKVKDEVEDALEGDVEDQSDEYPEYDEDDNDDLAFKTDVPESFIIEGRQVIVYGGKFKITNHGEVNPNRSRERETNDITHAKVAPRAAKDIGLYMEKGEKYGPTQRVEVEVEKEHVVPFHVYQREYSSQPIFSVRRLFDRLPDEVAQAAKKALVGYLEGKKTIKESEELTEATPTGIKLFYQDKSKKEKNVIVFSARDAADFEKDAKKMGYKMTHRALMYGAKTGDKVAVKEETEYNLQESQMDDQKLLMLARGGLIDRSQISIFKTAMAAMEADKPLKPAQRAIVIDIFQKLAELVTTDASVFQKAKKFAKEDTQPTQVAESNVYADYIKNIVR